MNLEKFMFPVEQRTVYVSNPDKENPSRTTKYKAIARTDQNKLISIVKDTYQVVPNSEIIKPLLDELGGFDTRWYIDQSHSFVENNRMRLQITFPELTFNDGKSDIALSLFLHNSYDGSEGVRMIWGAIRAICKNGMVFGTLLSKFYRKHTQGLDIINLKKQLQSTYDKIPVIQERIGILQNSMVNQLLIQGIEKKLGKTISKYVETQQKEQQTAVNQWILFNMITYYISHYVSQRMRAHYQMEAGKLFKL